MIDQIVSAARDLLQNTLISEQEKDRKGQPANIVDAIFALTRAIEALTKTRRKGDV